MNSLKGINMRNFTFILKSIVLLCVLTFSTNAWGKVQTFYSKCIVVAQPAQGGDVYVSKSKQKEGGFTFQDARDESSQEGDAGGWTWTASSKEFTFYGYQRAATGYTFKGWSTNPAATSGDTSTDDYNYLEDWTWKNYPYHEFTITASSKNSSSPTTVTYYAIFTPNKYTVKFNGNGGSTPADITVTYDAVYGELPIPTRTGYTFAGWWTAATGGTPVTADTKVQITATQTLYAHWTANNYTITLKSDLATSHGTKSIAVTFDSNTNLTSAITCPSRDKWTFRGYFTSENGAGTELIDKEGNVLASVSGFTDSNKKWIHADNLTLYAYMTEKSDQTITWDSITNGQEYATGTMGAIASSGLTVTYTYDNEEWAYINENNRLVVLVPNKTVTITAHQEGDDDYNAAEPVSRTFVTLGANPNQTTAVKATGITYGDLLSVSTLSGDVKLDDVVIPGTLSWVDPSIMPNAGTANHMVLFTPDNTDAYSSIYFEVPVTVAKATPVITWNIGSILREEVRYDHFVTSSNKEKDFSISVSNATLLNVSGTTLRTGSVDNRVTRLTITLTQEASDNYNRKTETKTVAIYPKSESCLPYDPMTGDDFNDKSIAGKDGSVEWCNTNEDGHDTYALVPVTYTQRVGIMLGNWKGGGNYSEKSVTLFFSGIPNQISFDYEVQVVSSPGIPWPATDITWILEESADGENYTELVHYLSVLGREYKSGNITHSLSENTRYVRITYGGNFAGFIKNIRITRKQYIRSDKSSLLFGTDSPLNPLQEPQAITLSYSSLGVCGGSTEDAITVTSSNPAFYVDEETITENVGIEQKGSYTIRVRCNNVNQEGMLTCTSNDGTTLSIPVRSTNPPISTAATDIFQTGTEHNPVFGTAYRAQQTLMSEEAGILAGLFNGSTPLFDELYIYGVSESATDSREWEYSPAKGYKVPVVNASNVHTPCFVYKKDGTQYTYVRTFDAAKTTLNAADSKTRVLVGYRPEGPAATALQLGTGAVVNLNNTEIVSTGVAIHVNGDTATVAARGKNTVTSASNAAVQLSGATSLGVEDNWKSGEASAVLALRPAAGYPSIDLGSASGRVYINGTQLELHNAAHMAIAHMEGTTENFDGEVHITDGSIGGEEILGMPKLTFIDGGTFNDGTVNAYTLKGVAKRPRNSRGEIVSRQTMTKTALEAYDWYGQAHLTLDGSAKVNPMLMDEEIWIFNGTNSDHSDDATSWNKESVPGETADVLINAPMVVSGGELKVKSLTINWEDKGKGIPAVTVNPDGGLTVGEGGIDGIKVNMVNNLALKAGAEGATKGQTGFLRIHPNSAEPMPEATVELYSIAYYNIAVDDRNDVGRWQFVGSPLANPVAAKAIYSESFLYEWNTQKGDWVNNRKKGELKPFMGYSTSQYMSTDGMKVTYAGELVSNDELIPIPLAYNGGDKISHNMLANSFTAPIDITKFSTTDFENTEAAIYLFNTGSRNDIANLESMDDGSKGGETFNTPGQYIHIPVGKIGEMKSAFTQMPTSIAPLQGFCVHATGANPKITMDYSKLVWGGDYSKNGNGPLRVAARDMSEYGQVRSLCVTLYGGGLADNLYMLESDENIPAYENGQDARKMMSGALNIFSVTNEDELAVDATNSFIGTRVGVRTGEETMYTMFFSHLNSEKELALLDWETEQITEITENAEYTFFAEPNSMITDRFEIIEWDGSNKPGIATGVENVENGTKVHKFIKDNQLFILKNGVLYNATGVLVR